MIHSISTILKNFQRKSTDTIREFNGEQVRAFGFGDVVKNQTHTATNATVVASTSTTTTVTLANTTGILVGHWVRFSGLNVSTELNFTGSKDNHYKVTGVSGNNITITATDDTVLTGITTGTNTAGTCQRMRHLLM